MPRTLPQRSDEKLFAIAFFIWLVGIVIGLAFWGVVIYVGYHFIAKNW